MEIGKIAFKKLKCPFNETTILNVKKFKNCVRFAIGTEHNILWHYEGKFYYGGWKNFSNGEGEKNGEGVEIVPGRYRFRGHFSEGRRNGYGIMIMENGTIYEGEWKDGVRHGHGKQEDLDGFAYDGEWKEGKRDGKAKIYRNQAL